MAESRLTRAIDETRERWNPELKQCQDALLDKTVGKPVRQPYLLARMIVEYDYLLVEAGKELRKPLRRIGNDGRKTS